MSSTIEAASRDSRSSVRAVVFDLDGVLVDSLAVACEAFATAYAEVVGGEDAPVAEYLRYPGRSFPEVLQMMGLPAAMEKVFVRENYRLASQITPAADILDVLSELRARGIRMAVATSKDGERARSLLRHLGMSGFFDHVIGADEVAHPKPAPDIILRALQLMDVDQRDAMMVGDSVSDLTSAKQAGVTAVAVLWGESDEATLLSAEPDVILREPTALLTLCRPAPLHALEIDQDTPIQ